MKDYELLVFFENIFIFIDHTTSSGMDKASLFKSNH